MFYLILIIYILLYLFLNGSYHVSQSSSDYEMMDL